MELKRCASSPVRKIIFRLFCILLVVIAVCKLLFLFDWLPSRLALAALLAALGFFALLCVFRRRVYAILSRLLGGLAGRLGPVGSLLLVVVLSLALKVLAICFLHIDSLSHPDIQVYVVSAGELNRLGRVVKYAGYCLNFPHMFWFAVTLRPILALLGESSTALSLYMAVVSTVSLVLLFDTLRRAVSLKCALGVCLLFSLLPSQILLPAFIVHEQMLTLFLCLAFWLLLGLPARGGVSLPKRAALFLCGVLSLAFSVQINAAGLVAVIAFCILFLDGAAAGGSRPGWPQRLGKVLVLLLALVLVGRLCTAYQAGRSEPSPDYEKEDRVLWTLFVGANADTAGMWSLEDTEVFDSYPEGSTGEQIHTFKRSLLQERYDALLRQPSRLLCLLRQKLSTVWSGFFYPCTYANELIRDPQRQALYHRYLFYPLSFLEYGLVLLLLLLCLSSLFRSPLRLPDTLYFSSLYMLGVTAMLLLTECNGKYTLSVQPFYIAACVILLAVCGPEASARGKRGQEGEAGPPRQ